MANFPKIENPTQLNFDELYDAGYNDRQIAEALAEEHGKDFDAYMDMGGSVGDFLYTYSNSAPPGSITAFTDRLIRGLTKSGPMVAGAVGGAKVGARIPFAQPAPTVAGAIIGGIAGAEVGEDIVDYGEDMQFFETRPPLRSDRFAAVMGETVGEGLPMVFSAPYLAKSGVSTAGALVSDRLNRIQGLRGSLVRAPGKAYSAAERFLGKVGKTARGEEGKAAQKAFFGVETTALGTSALGGATGQETLGLGETGRLGGEIAGGLFEPRLFVVRTMPRLINSITGKFGSDARESQIGQNIYRTLVKYGEDPDEVIRSLEENPDLLKRVMDDVQVSLDLPPLTPAQITGSPVLTLLQNQVAKRSPTSVLEQEAVARAQRGYEFIEQLAQGLIAQGDDESVRLATQLRTDAIADLITQSLIGANTSAQNAATRLGQQADFDVIGNNLRTQFDQIIKNANEQEARLWAKVPKNMEVEVNKDFFDAIKAVRNKYFLETEDFPSNIAGQIGIFSARAKAAEEAESLLEAGEEVPFNVEPITVDQLTKLRSRTLDAARIAMKDGDKTKAKALGDLANVILSQLDSLAEGGDEAYDLARAFSRGKNDALRRTFLGDVNARDRDGADVYEPTLLASYLFNGGADATAIRFREIQDGAGAVRRELDRLGVDEDLRIPLDDVEFGPVSEQSLNTALAQAVQYAASKTIDPSTGRINPRASAKFLEDNEVLLRTFPQVREMLEDGRQFEDMVKLMTNNQKRYEKEINGNKVLAKVLRYESPTVAIGEALGGNRPVDSLESVINTVKRAGRGRFADQLAQEGFEPGELMDGLKSSMIEWMWTKAGGSGGNFNFDAAMKAMFEPLVKGKTTASTARGARTTEQAAEAGARARQRVSVADVLQREGVFTQAELDRLKFLLERGQKIDAAGQAGRLSDEMVDEMGFTTDLLIRLGGARFGTGVASATGMKSQGLVEAGAGVRFAQNVFGKVPQGMQLNMLELAVTDPDFLVKVLKKGKTEANIADNIRFLHAYLVNAGLQASGDDDVSPGPDVEIETPLYERPSGLGPYIVEEEQVSMAPTLPQVPASPAPLSAPAPSADLLARAPSSPQTAQRMAAAFPNDGILGLMGRG